ncbi:CBS domain-containing protein [Micromonospora sp. CPCC 206061]|uniref:CBS domain-containing protein n=1 Tax=Micromonospora sp. CPCC 206061 TaxID=3122410 RepID=UPI002FF0A9A8
MPQWRVRDVMARDVITVRDDALIPQIAAVLAERQISAVPVVDRFETVTGVISWTDLRDTVETTAAGSEVTGRWWPVTRQRLRWPNVSAVDVMSAPPVTVMPNASLATAGRLMRRRKVGRLLVVDDQARLMGIITRSDLFRVHDRPDAVIRDEVTQRILHRELKIPTADVVAAVDDGVVTLTGHTDRRTTALAAVAMTAAVPGATDVVDEITYHSDDTLRTAPKPSAPDPLANWWHQAASLPINGGTQPRSPGFDDNVGRVRRQRPIDTAEVASAIELAE